MRALESERTIHPSLDICGTETKVRLFAISRFPIRARTHAPGAPWYWCTCCTAFVRANNARRRRKPPALHALHASIMGACARTGRDACVRYLGANGQNRPSNICSESAYKTRQWRRRRQQLIIMARALCQYVCYVYASKTIHEPFI